MTTATRGGWQQRQQKLGLDFCAGLPRLVQLPRRLSVAGGTKTPSTSDWQREKLGLDFRANALPLALALPPLLLLAAGSSANKNSDLIFCANPPRLVSLPRRL